MDFSEPQNLYVIIDLNKERLTLGGLLTILGDVSIELDEPGINRG